MLKKLLKSRQALTIGLVLLAIFLVSGHYLQSQLKEIYQEQDSLIVRDRKGETIFIAQNPKGYWARYSSEIPSGFRKLLISKEDKYFYYHPGFNPWSIVEAGLNRLGVGERRACSTITQQLAKILLGNETERNLKNKIIELFYALSLEVYNSKDAILEMYVNSVYFGSQAQGLEEASVLYFDLSPEMLTQGQTLQLLAAISSPTKNNPAKPGNKEAALGLARNLDLQEFVLTDLSVIKANMEKYSHYSDTYFEVSHLSGCESNLTIDQELTEKIRKIVSRNIEELILRKATNGAVVVIKLPENELLALVGSPDPRSSELGYKINMLLEPRAIGSTVKPFIYLKAFEKGLRPYTLVDDREYKYITAAGFPLYPKNFDFKYRGIVDLHYAISNSLNVPAVKVLEYVGLENFYRFLEKDLGFQPVQDLDDCQLGIALGGLEMSLLDLTEYFTIFPNEGVLKELKVCRDSVFSEKRIADYKYIQLINKVLHDRKTGIEQFGLKSDLNLFQENYALKTGTSRDFHDSWVIGYTPDLLVGVWVGNADNTPMEEVSGQAGAGRIWAETMELLLNSEYNLKTPFEFNLLKEFCQEENIEYGLPEDNYESCLNILGQEDNALILNPHDDDIFLLEKNSRIMLEAKEVVGWYIDGRFLGEARNIILPLEQEGEIIIKAEGSDVQEVITIYVTI